MSLDQTFCFALWMPRCKYYDSLVLITTIIWIVAGSEGFDMLTIEAGTRIGDRCFLFILLIFPFLSLLLSQTPWNQVSKQISQLPTGQTHPYSTMTLPDMAGNG